MTSPAGRASGGSRGDEAPLLPQSDPLSRWIQERARDFRDFDLSLPGALNPVFADPFAAVPSRRSLCLPQDFSRTDPFFSRQDPLFSTQDPVFNRQELVRQDRLFNRQEPISFRQEPAAGYGTMSGEKELSPKAKVSYDQEKFQVEFNVQDYKPEELSIKTEGDVLVVLGKQEHKEGGQTYVSKQFEQRFSLPSGARPENITSALSKDGYLTVTAPRDQVAIKSKPRTAIETADKTGQVFQQSAQTRGEGLPHPRVKYDEEKFQISLDAQEYKPEELDVKVEGNNIIITAKQEIQEAGGTRTRVFEQKFSLPSGVKAEKVSSSLTKDGVLVVTAPRGNTAANQSYTHTIENSMNKVLNPTSWEEEKRRDLRDTPSSSSAPFSSTRLAGGGGSLFDADTSAIANSRHGAGSGGSLFESSRANSLFDDTTSFFDRSRTGSIFDNEKSLFAANSEQSGVSRVEYDDDLYKIHVKVENFKPEELIVKTVDNTVQVEAKHEEKTADGHSYSTRSFQQSFTLPRGVDLETISSALSKDGILTISAPLPPSLRLPNSERLVPIKHH